MQHQAPAARPSTSRTTRARTARAATPATASTRRRAPRPSTSRKTRAWPARAAAPRRRHASRGARGGGAAEDQAALRGADDARPRDVGAREASLRALGEYLGVIALRQRAALAAALPNAAALRRCAARCNDAVIDEFRGLAPDPLAFGLELVDEADEIAGAPPLPPDDPLRRCYVAEAAGADDSDANTPSPVPRRRRALRRRGPRGWTRAGDRSDRKLSRWYLAKAAGADDGDAEMCLRRRLDAGPSTAKSIEGDADCAGPASGQRRRRSRMLTDLPGYCFSIAPAELRRYVCSE